MDYIGEITALLSSLFWAGSNFAFQQSMDLFSPMMLNFYKCFISTLVLIVILPLFSIDLFPLSDPTPYISLMISGVCGIAVGDSFFFITLNELGARKTLLMETLASPMTGLIAYVYYGTTISLLGWVGIALTLYGLYIVIGEGEPEIEKVQENIEELLPIETSAKLSDQTYFPEQSAKRTTTLSTQNHIIQLLCSKGVICGAAAMFCQSLGMVLSSSVLSTGNLNSLWATLMRIAPSNLALYPFLKYFQKEQFTWPRLSMRDNIGLVSTILISTIFCIWMSQLSLIYTRPEISQTLLATSPLFGILIGRFKGEIVTTKQVVGSLVCVFGVVFIVYA